MAAKFPSPTRGFMLRSTLQRCSCEPLLGVGELPGLQTLEIESVDMVCTWGKRMCRPKERVDVGSFSRKGGARLSLRLFLGRHLKK